MNLIDAVTKSKETGDYSNLIDHCPYANFIGMQMVQYGEDYLFHLPQKQSNLGNPTLPALHGGVIAGFVEHSASIFLIIKMAQPKQPKIIDFSIDYLRAGHFKDTYCVCEIARIGRKIANVQMKAWQTTQDEPIVLARAQFLLS